MKRLFSILLACLLLITPIYAAEGQNLFTSSFAQSVYPDKTIGMEWTAVNRSGKTITEMQVTVYFLNDDAAMSRLYQKTVHVKSPIAADATFRINTPLNIRLDTCTRLELSRIILFYEDGSSSDETYQVRTQPVAARPEGDNSAIASLNNDTDDVWNNNRRYEDDPPAPEYSMIADLSWPEAELMWKQATERIRGQMGQSDLKFTSLGEKEMNVYRKPNGQYSFAGKVDYQQGMKLVRKSWLVSGEKEGSGTGVRFQISNALVF